MTRQRERARAAIKFAGSASLPGEVLGTLSPTQFCGYDTLVAQACTVLALVVDGRSVERIAAGEDAIVVLDKTPFYAESGGQVGDTGSLSRSEEHTSELQSLMRISYAVFCLKKKKKLTTKK